MKKAKKNSKIKIPSVLITRMFQLISERKFTESERILERIKQRMVKKQKNEYNRGYLRALNGIILTQRAGGESWEFFNDLDINDVETLKIHYSNFLKNTKKRFHADFDRGFFSALADYLRVILYNIDKDGKEE